MSKFISYCIVFCLLSGAVVAQSKTDKVQKTVDLLKKIYRYRDGGQDYITDGEQIVWVKYYKRWAPTDLATLKKEHFDALIFLRDASLHRRFDVLSDLLPDYYRDHGGVQAFADDILRVSQDKKTGGLFLKTPRDIVTKHFNANLYSKFSFTINTAHETTFFRPLYKA